LFTCAGLCLTWFLNAAWAAGLCHIHPVRTDMKDTELRTKEFMADRASVIVFRMEFSIEQAMTGGLG